MFASGVSAEPSQGRLVIEALAGAVFVVEDREDIFFVERLDDPAELAFDVAVARLHRGALVEVLERLDERGDAAGADELEVLEIEDDLFRFFDSHKE